MAEIGPLFVKAGVSYTAAYIKRIMFPGAETGVHRHPGPEALYPLSGEECMETPEGKFIGVPEGKPVIVPADTPHQLTITGTAKRRSLRWCCMTRPNPGRSERTTTAGRQKACAKPARRGLTGLNQESRLRMVDLPTGLSFLLRTWVGYTTRPRAKPSRTR